MDILRFITAGSVDDGKSTLIGRLLYDSKSILADQLQAIEKNNTIDLALLTDGLRSEREQGITIDVAYRYFSTPRRKFIVADAPGHEQYTRNMITGASNADIVIILIDAGKGVTRQTKRHSIIASLLQLPVIVTINKMDTVGYSEGVFNDIIINYNSIARELGLNNVHYLPISALNGDNIVERSSNMTWYHGKPLLEFLEEISIENKTGPVPARFQVQFTIRPQSKELPDFRGYAGRIISGTYKRGDKIVVLPSGFESTISSIEIGGMEADYGIAPQAVTILLENEIDISRGDSIVKVDDTPTVSDKLSIMVCWMDRKPLKKGNRYLLQHNSKLVKVIVSEINYRIDVNSLEKVFHCEEIQFNEIALARIEVSEPLAFDPYSKLKSNGGIILIDETSNATAGGGIIQ